MSDEAPKPPPFPESQIAQHSALFWIVTGVFGMVGVVGLLSGIVDFSALFSGGPSLLVVGDVLFNIAFGVAMLWCARWMMQGKLQVVWLFAGVIAVALVYSLIAGRGLNLTLAAVGFIGVGLLYAIEKNGELA